MPYRSPPLRMVLGESGRTLRYDLNENIDDFDTPVGTFEVIAPSGTTMSLAATLETQDGSAENGQLRYEIAAGILAQEGLHHIRPKVAESSPGTRVLFGDIILLNVVGSYDV